MKNKTDPQFIIERMKIRLEELTAQMPKIKELQEKNKELQKALDLAVLKIQKLKKG